MRSFLKKRAGNKKGFLSRLSSGFSTLILGKKTIDAALLESLEALLLGADIGFKTTDILIQRITDRIHRKSLQDPEKLQSALKEEMVVVLKSFAIPITLNHNPFIILMVGINGAGKTTSIAKLAHYYQQQGKSILLAAGDTFRAAAIDQLRVWGERNQVAVVSQHPGADSASVIYDAIQSAAAKKTNILIADTAGRLHTQSNLMNELKKIKRVIQKTNPEAPHETMLVVDGGTGQNALQQAKEFHEAIGLTGISVTKLDGTAKGGMIFAITQETQLPVRFIGVGESMGDWKPFDPAQFVEDLFAV